VPSKTVNRMLGLEGEGGKRSHFVFGSFHKGKKKKWEKGRSGRVGCGAKHAKPLEGKKKGKTRVHDVAGGKTGNRYHQQGIKTALLSTLIDEKTWTRKGVKEKVGCSLQAWGEN